MTPALGGAGYPLEARPTDEELEAADYSGYRRDVADERSKRAGQARSRGRAGARARPSATWGRRLLGGALRRRPFPIARDGAASALLGDRYEEPPTRSQT